MKQLSVVIANGGNGSSLEACLASLRKQMADGAVETIVVDGSANNVSLRAQQDFPEVRWIAADWATLVPELWGCGAREATGEAVAFTTAQFIPDEGWVAELLSHGRSEHAAVGGAIEQSEPAPMLQWAVYFCRYAGYMPPFQSRRVEQIPGDNAIYKRWVLERYAPMIQAGFWEYEINRRLIAEGHSLLLNPCMRVVLVESCRASAFCRERFVHGRLFGAERRARASFWRRLAYAASLPLIPAIQLANIGRKVLGKKRRRREFLLALPWIVLFVSCWSIGEYLGYLIGGTRRLGARR